MGSSLKKGRWCYWLMVWVSVTQLSYALPARGSVGSVVSSKAPLPISALAAQARLTSVQILVGGGWGSGILIRRRGQVYRVITNQHVLGSETRYRIRTPDARVYEAVQRPYSGWQDDDLALLEFQSNQAYAIAPLSDSNPADSESPMSSRLKDGDSVFAVGFPYDAELVKPKGFVVLTGQVNFITPKAISGGYRIGYSNPVEKGMSGGALLNQRGEVVGINGRHAYPLWESPFVFQDGSRPDLAESLMVQSSWAIPVERFRAAAD